jgi:DUF1680 family protein
MENQIVSLTQKTRYPWNGQIDITINPDKEGEFSIMLRIPGWAQNKPVPSNLYRYLTKNTDRLSLTVNNESIDIRPEKGFVRIKRVWKKDDRISLYLPMPVRRVLSHDKVEDNADRVALERGPLVYCAEWPDNKNEISKLILSDHVIFETEFKKNLLNGVQIIKGEHSSGKTIVAIPYNSWANRGPGEMAVWLNRN